VTAARDTLGAASGVAQQLPAGVGATVLDVARDAFVHSMQVVSTISLVLSIGVAILTFAMLRNVDRQGDEEPDAEAELDHDSPPRQPAPTATSAQA
jgi:DHA2 family multidrug resistance protein-like MFS transporter